MVTAANADKSTRWIVAPAALAVLKQVFSMERFPTRQLRASLAAMFRNQQLCDLQVEVEGRTFHVHRCLLAAESAYFMACVTGTCGAVFTLCTSGSGLSNCDKNGATCADAGGAARGP